MSQIGLQLPIAQFDILFETNDVDMKWKGYIGLHQNPSEAGSWLRVCHASQILTQKSAPKSVCHEPDWPPVAHSTV
jgi:hypothetical protein